MVDMTVRRLLTSSARLISDDVASDSEVKWEVRISPALRDLPVPMRIGWELGQEVPQAGQARFNHTLIGFQR